MTHGKPTCLASEGSFGEFEVPLGSRETPRTRHRRIGGSHQHHLPAGPHATVDQFGLRRADGRVGGLAGHRGLARNFGVKSSTAIKWSVWYRTTSSMPVNLADTTDTRTPRKEDGASSPS